jgi:predicted nucleotidyltransferase
MTGVGLPIAERRELSRFLCDTEAEFVVLIGSWARKNQSPEISDIDLLVGLPSGSRSPRTRRIQPICLSSEEIVKRVSEGDDLAQWSLRFGVPLSGREGWERLKDDVLPNAPWPSSDRKFELATKELDYAGDLRAMGDHDAAQDELKAALGHLARGLLLERRTFPLSRPELSDQLREAGLGAFASLLEATSTRSLTRAEIADFVEQGRALISERAISA